MPTCKTKICILEVCLSPDLGGLELYALRCAKHFRASMVIAKDSKLAGYLEEEDLKYEKIGRKNPFALAKIIDTCKADVLHVHGQKTFLWLFLQRFYPLKGQRLCKQDTCI
jgi:hypothetical protein